MVKWVRLGKGGKVEPEFSHHEEDMKREDTSDTYRSVRHGKSSMNLIAEEKAKNIEFSIEISDLETNLENVSQWEIELEKLQTEKAELLLNQKETTKAYQENSTVIHQENVQVTNQINEYKRKLIALNRTKNYLANINESDSKTKNQLLDIIEKIAQFEEKIVQNNKQLQVNAEAIKESDSKQQEYLNTVTETLDEINHKIIELSQSISSTQVKIAGRTLEDLEILKKEWLDKKDTVSRKEQFLITKEVTEGRHPDHSIQLPTQDSGVDYYLDENKILQAMLAERTQHYSFMHNNCAGSVKRCILAGIDENLREKLMETGLKNNFFKVKSIETAKGLVTWVNTLESKLHELNFQFHPTI